MRSAISPTVFDVNTWHNTIQPIQPIHHKLLVLFNFVFTGVKFLSNVLNVSDMYFCTLETLILKTTWACKFLKRRVRIRVPTHYRMINIVTYRTALLNITLV